MFQFDYAIFQVVAIIHRTAPTAIAPAGTECEPEPTHSRCGRLPRSVPCRRSSSCRDGIFRAAFGVQRTIPLDQPRPLSKEREYRFGRAGQQDTTPLPAAA